MEPGDTVQNKPVIMMTNADHDRLSALAERVSASNPIVAEQLLAELDRARLVADGQLPSGVVRIGTTVRYTTDTGEDRTVTLVYPAEADIAEGKVSILTPIGAALIGLSAGQSIDWIARDGRSHRLTVAGVEAKDEAPNAGPST